MEVQELVDIIYRVCGLGVNWAKACIYYCMATFKLKLIDWMPALIIMAPPASGKSKLMDILLQLAYKPTIPPISCEGISYPTLRDELEKAHNRTALLEEADLHPNRKQLEGLLLARVDKKRTSTLRGKEPPAEGKGKYKNVTRKIFGATIVHDRHGLTDLATERRAIIVSIKHQGGQQFINPPTNLTLPSFSFGNIPEMFNSSQTVGSGLDTWEPLIRIADSLNDDEWLSWAWGKVAEANEALADGYQYELEQCVFGAVIKGFSDRTGMGLVADNIAKTPLPLSIVTETVSKDYRYIAPKTVGTTLRKMNFDVHKLSGVFQIFTTIDQLKEIAQEIGYKDEALG